MRKLCLEPRASLLRGLCGLGLLAALIGPILLTPAGEPRQSSQRMPKVQLWVAAYYYPFGKGLHEWERLMKSARRAPIVAIVNPNSGPGTMPDTNYAAVTRRARKAGVKLVGYIGTQYTKKPLNAVEAEVDTWIRFYPRIQGIHVDEQTSDAAHAEYYAKLYQYIRAQIPGALVLSNPGTSCASAYLLRPTADAICLFESDKGFDSFRPPAWARRFSPNRFAVQAYDVGTAEKMQAYLRAAVRLRIGYVYVTDARGANPYDRLPSYWEKEVAAVQRINQTR